MNCDENSQQSVVPEDSRHETAKERSVVLPFLSCGIVYMMVVVAVILVFGALIFLLRSAHTVAEKQQNATESQDSLSINSRASDGLSTSFSVLEAKANYFIQEGDISKAMEIYEKALENGGGVDTMRKLFDLAILIGDRQRAERVLGLLAFRGSDEGALDVMRAFILLRSGAQEEAKVIFEKEKRRPEAVYGLLLVSILNVENDAAELYVSQLLESNDPVIVHIAEVIQGALDEFSLFQDGGKEAHLQTLLARSLARVGQCPLALALLDSVLQSEADYRDAWIIHGYCHLLLEEFDTALESFESAYSLDPEKSETQYFLGMTYDQLGKEEDARRFFEYALQNGFQPQIAVRRKLAQYALSNNRYEEALREYMALIDDFDKKEPGIQEGQGPVALGVHQSRENGAVYRTAAILLFDKLRRQDEAFALIEKAHAMLGETPDVLDLLGWKSMIDGDLDRAAVFFHTAIEQDPQLAYAWYHRGQLFERIGDREDAIMNYKTAHDLALDIDDALAAEAMRLLQVLRN